MPPSILLLWLRRSGPQSRGEDLYRLSCMIVDIDHFMERSYLDALAAALKISEARKGQLEEEARQAKAQLAAHAG